MGFACQMVVAHRAGLEEDHSMQSSTAVAPVARTLIVCLTVAFLGYLGFLLLRPNLAPDKEIVPATQQEIWQRNLKIWRLYAAYNDARDKIKVSGKIACRGGVWESVTIAFIFRGPNNVVNHQENYVLPDVTKKTPLRPGIVREFSFEIPRFKGYWEEHHVEALILDARPLE